MKPEQSDPRDVEIADNMRAFAEEKRQEYLAAQRVAAAFEYRHGIFPPCGLCGRRDCGH